jgi:hypothetical protein
VAGIEIGNEIIAIDGRETHDLGDIIHGIALRKNRDSQDPLSTIASLRKGKQKEVTQHPVLIEQNAHSKESIRTIGLEIFQELVISKIHPNSLTE